ncbi:MAG: hydroxyisourate hydrolase [Vulcanimicrobiota bacterium]
MSAITTHVLDTSLGRPGQQIAVRLFREEQGEWRQIGQDKTDDDGRVKGLLAGELQAGIHRIEFDTGEYFRRTNRQGFYPYVEITFEVTSPQEHHHVPLLLNPFGFSTYRGS